MSLQLVGTGSNRTDLTATGTTHILARPGRLAQIVVWNVGTGATIDVYDDPTGTTNHCWSWATADGKGVFALQYPILNGLTIVVAGTAPSLSVVTA
jgi:WD40 repeat protein